MDPYHQIKGKSSILLEFKADNGQMHKLRLCSYYGCYEHESTVEIKDQTIPSFFCPHCHEELMSNHLCEECEAPMIPFSMEKGGRLFICSRKGCKQHYLNFKNVSDGLRKLYNEYGYF
jgi:hypothetical protein